MTNTIADDTRSNCAAGPANPMRHTELLLLAQQQADRHIEVEITEDVDDILGTLADAGPYAYTLNPTLEDGRLRQHLAQTREGIRQSYVELHLGMALRGWISTSQVLAPWYTFHAGWATVEVKAETTILGEVKKPGDRLDVESLVLFPTMGRTGITGELFWARTGPGAGAANGQSLSELRRDLLADHDAYLDALRSGDVDGAVASLAPEGQVGLRDYTNDTPGALAELDGRQAAADHLRRFFARYVPERIEVVQRHADEWYVFAETRWTVTSVADGARLTFLTADYAEIGPDRKIVARIGHGTEPVPA